jgi:hypothetical protein
MAVIAMAVLGTVSMTVMQARKRTARTTMETSIIAMAMTAVTELAKTKGNVDAASVAVVGRMGVPPKSKVYNRQI